MIKDIYEAGFDENLTRSIPIEEEFSYEENKAAQDMEFKNLEIYKEGTLIINTATKPDPFGSFYIDEATVSHNLGYIPTFEVYIKTFNGTFSPLPYKSFPEVAGSNEFAIYSATARCNEIQLTVEFSRLPTTIPVEFKYFLYKDRIE